MDMYGGSVELVYRLTPQDVAYGLDARARATRAGRRARRLLVAIGVLLPLGGALDLWKGERPATGAVMVALGAAAWLLRRYGTRLTARGFTGLLAKAGEMRTTVDDTGIRLVAADSDTRVGWRLQPRYVETEHVFVMLSEDRRAVGLTVLPKRAATDPADIDRIRSIFDRNLTRAS
ncbi:YcxB family protein [Streptomyces sp. NPDC059982]|uniref:YcxB family protein n=1 Tax=unclassified Streptomyces TaxID=2593676 RepID=UPI00367602FF